MIICIEEQLIIFTPPKTGSCSLHTLLCEEHNKIYAIGPRWYKNNCEKCRIDHHTMIAPNIYLKHFTGNFKTVCIVRNPYDRFKSLYKHYLFRINHKYITPKYFYKNVIKNITIKDSFFLSLKDYINTQSNCIISEFWKIEDIAKHLKNHKLPTNIKHENRLDKNIDPIFARIDNIDVSFVKDWAIKDLIYFEY